MKLGQWACYAIALIAAIAAGLGTMPYGWAHVAATALGSALATYAGAAGIVAQRAKP